MIETHSIIEIIPCTQCTQFIIKFLLNLSFEFSNLVLKFHTISLKVPSFDKNMNKYLIPHTHSSFFSSNESILTQKIKHYIDVKYSCVSMEMTLRTWWAWRPPVAPGNRYSVFHMIVIMERKYYKNVSPWRFTMLKAF